MNIGLLSTSTMSIFDVLQLKIIKSIVAVSAVVCFAATV